MRRIAMLVGTMLVLTPISATQAAPAKASAKSGPAAKPADMKVPDMSAIMGIFDKMFPPQPDPDPARLALARSSAATMWPAGSYRDMMIEFVGGMADRVMTMKPSDFAGLPGKDAKPKAAGGDLSLHDSLATKDPYFDQRVAAIRAAVVDELGKVAAIIDPRVRDGMARAMARRFDARQLTDINVFLATPSGHAFAGQYMRIWLDPDMMRAMMSTMPETVKLMPEVMEKVKAANDRFPAPPSDKKDAPKSDKAKSGKS